MSGSMNDSDRVFVRQFAKLIGGLIVLTVSLVTIAWGTWVTNCGTCQYTACFWRETLPGR